MSYTEVSARSLQSLKNRIKKSSAKHRKKIVKIKLVRKKPLYMGMKIYRIYYKK